MELERETAGAGPLEPWTEARFSRCTDSAPGWGGGGCWRPSSLGRPGPSTAAPMPSHPAYGWLGLSLTTCEMGCRWWHLALSRRDDAQAWGGIRGCPVWYLMRGRKQGLERGADTQTGFPRFIALGGLRPLLPGFRLSDR